MAAQSLALVPVFTGVLDHQTTQLVDARQLHAFLEVGRRFTSWITERIAEYSFTESQDYKAISQKREIGHGRGRTDYHLSLDMAKELSMVERNDRGRQARRYFIECEKRLRQIAPQQAELIARDVIGLEKFLRLSGLIRGKVSHLPAGVRKAASTHLWAQVHKAFGVSTGKALLKEHFGSACAFIGAYALEGEYLGPQQNSTPTARLALVDLPEQHYSPRNRDHLHERLLRFYDQLEHNGIDTSGARFIAKAEYKMLTSYWTRLDEIAFQCQNSKAQSVTVKDVKMD